ncbi:MAG: hypothetical protein A2Y34_00900 [Spirochaetes bacterium GWC1_27_15]|nr:MAG: hypothetical protein A2Z98_01105 [Spirochaetes bacterium GWB1_27_13]OHD25538.1 MAG: hypothetical protein A2Y34_00900 [Spirochaetes bacterium GWC1_27_15]
MKPLYIYNLFPRLYKNAKEWEKNITKISNMGFNCIYLNPFHYPGFSGSLYAPKDYYEYHPLFFSKVKSPDEQLKDFIDACKEKNIDVFMDLVVNHTSIDCPLIKDHKEWYVLGEDGDVKRPGAWENGHYITWGDLATFNLDTSPDREGLWNYLLNMCLHYLKMGFKGFRCDAAYQVPNEFWVFLISKIKSEFPETVFLAETLGCMPVQIQVLSKCGFDYIFNSSKWWNFNDSWCLEQYSLTRNIAPSVSFPETHDTPRLFEEVGKNEIAFLQRLYFEAIFSQGFMIITGFEYGFTKKVNVVDSKPEDWEDTGRDYTKKIKNILAIKNALKPLHEESRIEIIDQSNWMNIFCFVKEWEGERVLLLLNKDINNCQKIYLENIEAILRDTKIKDFSPEERTNNFVKTIDITLRPGELKIFAPEKNYKTK